MRRQNTNQYAQIKDAQFQQNLFLYRRIKFLSSNNFKSTSVILYDIGYPKYARTLPNEFHSEVEYRVCGLVVRINAYNIRDISINMNGREYLKNCSFQIFYRSLMSIYYDNEGGYKCSYYVDCNAVFLQ